MIKWIF